MFLEEDDVETLRMNDPSRREEDYIIITDDMTEGDTPEIVTSKSQQMTTYQ